MICILLLHSLVWTSMYTYIFPSIFLSNTTILINSSVFLLMGRASALQGTRLVVLKTFWLLLSFHGDCYRSQYWYFRFYIGLLSIFQLIRTLIWVQTLNDDFYDVSIIMIITIYCSCNTVVDKNHKQFKIILLFNSFAFESFAFIDFK